jgi:SpoVK/Ycf46/Vps4 family AAA+-type ATPase
VNSDPLLASLRAAVAAAPDDVALRVHLAHLLMKAGLHTEAIVHAAGALTRDPDNAAAAAVIAATTSGSTPSARPPSAQPPSAQPTPAAPASARRRPTDDEVLARLDAEFDVAAQPGTAPDAAADGAAGRVESAGLRLADVGGMQDVKARLEASFLAPLRNPELRELYRSSLRGGLLLYGPPGCGKTMIARALAGELGAGFLSVSLADVLDGYLGGGERNLQELFRQARRNAPCVVFLDELDAIGQKRSHLQHSGTRGMVNQLLTEMDGITGQTDDVYVLAATNHPWDVDVALRRPGRLDRMMLVTPPDLPARKAILAAHLGGRPVAALDLHALAGATDGCSGADLAHLVATAAERALLDSARTGALRPIEMADLGAALHEARPSIGPWLDVARNVAQFSNDGGVYDDLAAYLRSRGRR